MTIYELVKTILQEQPEMRDSDKKLTWHVWKVLGFVKNNVLLQEAYYKHTCPTPESITRARRMVMDKHPELQASLNVKRQRATIQKSKGTYVFRQHVPVKKNGYWDTSTGIARWIEK